ncbi:TIGR01244 family sulfur transferase [Litorivita sp. NS0012-18]|uniref:TIGR01244 family sulfur transferase n=1 Tax=Litorivita sp. NS0012-18 TaxID=3127655 RepID=UPI003107A1F2
MDIRNITPRYAVSPQIEPQDLAALKAEGFTTVICNRPDAEIPPALQANAMAAAAAEAGLAFHVIPLTHQTMNPENIAAQKAAMEGSAGPVLAYCASGTRCSVIWSLMQAGQMPTDEIIAATAKAGYQLDGLRPTLEALAAPKP